MMQMPQPWPRPVGEPHAVTAMSFTQPSALGSELESYWTAASITATPARPAKAATERAAGARATLTAAPSRKSMILDLAGGNIEAATSEMVGKAYASGDQLATEILQGTVELLTAWLSNIVDLLDPDVLVMGGGVAAMPSPFFGEIKDRPPSRCVHPLS